MALYDEMDYQRVVQAYIWATPMLNSMGFHAGMDQYGVNEKNGKILVCEQSLNSPQIVMTANQRPAQHFEETDRHSGRVDPFWRATRTPASK